MAFEYMLNIKDNGTIAIKKMGDSVINFQQNLVQAEAKINILSKSISKMGAAVAGAGGIIIAKGTAAIKDFAKEMVDSYDSAAKLSDNIGVAADSIVGLRYAADLSGVGAESMDKNLAKLSQTISKAAGGSKEAAGTFAKMGIAVKNSDGTLKNSEQVLMEMADAFKKLPAGAERATLAMDVFGKSGASMVTMLKDGSGALREMVNEGAGAAGNIEGISDSMQRLNSAMDRGKMAVMSLMASLADTAPIKAAIGGIESLSKSLIKLMGEMKAAENRDKAIAEMTKQGYLAELKTLEAKRLLLQTTEQYNELSDKGKREAQQAAEDEIKTLLRKAHLTQQEITYAQSKGKIVALNKIQETHNINDNLKAMLANAQANVDYQDTLKETARIEAEKAKAQAAADAAAVAAYGEKEAAMEKARKAAEKAAEDARRLAEQEAKEKMKAFEDLVSNREAALKKLEEIEDKMRIESLSGEEKKIEQALANYKKQAEDMKALHELEMLLAADKDETFEKQSLRIASLQLEEGAALAAISQEYADKRLKNSEAIAKFEEDMRNRNLSGEALAMAQLEASYEKRREELGKLHEEELANAADREAVQKAQNARMLALERAFADERRAISRAAVVQSASDSLEAISQMTAGYKSYAGLYKASQIGQAIINAHQSVLKTMASIPYPLNIPVASLQAMAAGFQVAKIKATPMYRGGMIPGRNTLVRANEEGPEAILTTYGVRTAGGPAGVDALNRGDSIFNTNNSRTSTIQFNINAALLTGKTWRDEINPVIEKERRLR